MVRRVLCVLALTVGLLPEATAKESKESPPAAGEVKDGPTKETVLEVTHAGAPSACAAELRANLEGTPFGDYTVTDLGQLLITSPTGGDCSGASPERCVFPSTWAGFELEFAAVEVDGLEYCACICDRCGVIDTADLATAAHWSDLPLDEGSPPLYAVANPAQLASLARDQEALDHDYYQCRDLRMADHYAPATDADPGRPYFIVGSSIEPFTGSYDGNGFSILDFTYRDDTASYEDPTLDGGIVDAAGHVLRTSTDHVGLFGKTRDASISGVNLVDVNLRTTDTSFAGALAGEVVGGTIHHTQASGSVSLTGVGVAGGGLVGAAQDARIEATRSEVDLFAFGFSQVGGIAGRIDGGGHLMRSSSTGRVEGYALTGGLVGDSRGSSVLSDAWSGSEIHGLFEIGGVVGSLDGSTAQRTYFAGTINGGYETGGAVGTMHNEAELAHSFVLPGYVYGVSWETGDVTGWSIWAPPWPDDLLVTNVHFWESNDICPWCDEYSPAIPHTFQDLAEATEFFGDPEANDALASWDFDTVWQTVPSDLPVLR
jgi:hypothetical protein